MCQGNKVQTEKFLQEGEQHYKRYAQTLNTIEFARHFCEIMRGLVTNS